MPLIDFDRIKRAVMLDEKVYAEIANDKEGLPPAVVVVVLATILGALWLIIGTMGLGLIIVLLTLIAWVIMAGVMHITAKVLGGKADFISYLKALGLGEAPAALGVIPFIGGLIGAVWSIVCYVVATKVVHQLSTGKSIIVAVLPILMAVLVVVVGIVLWQLGVFGAGLPIDEGY